MENGYIAGENDLEVFDGKGEILNLLSVNEIKEKSYIKDKKGATHYLFESVEYEGEIIVSQHFEKINTPVFRKIRLCIKNGK